MKFLMFNIAIIGALYYLFTNDVNGAREMTNSAQQTVNRIEMIASSAVAEVRKQTNVKETALPAPETAPKQESLAPISSPVSISTRPQPVPEEMIAETPINEEPAEVVPAKSTTERRRELLEMAQNMELFYLRKAGQ